MAATIDLQPHFANKRLGIKAAVAIILDSG
jgi:hypothetical protein